MPFSFNFDVRTSTFGSLAFGVFFFFLIFVIIRLYWCLSEDLALQVPKTLGGWAFGSKVAMLFTKATVVI